MHAPTLYDVVQPYMHLPTALQNALVRVETHPTFRVLTRAHFRVLKALITRASATCGTRPIRARLDIVSMEADVAYKTAQRAMRQFRELGWVEPATEGRNEYGVFCSKRYVLAAALCELVELPTGRESKAREPEMSDGAVYVDLNLKKDLLEIQREHQTPDTIKLPPAVQTLPEETGIRATGICKLLGIAKRAGHRLEHVWAVARPYLTPARATPGRVYRYLYAMLTNPKQTDYTARASQMERQAVQATLDDVARQCRYKRYQHIKTGMRVQVFDGTADVTIGNDTVRYVGEQMQGIYRGILNGNLRELLL